MRGLQSITITILLVLVVLGFTIWRTVTSLMQQNTRPYPSDINATYTDLDKDLALEHFYNDTTRPSLPDFKAPLRTEGRYIVDASGKRVKLASINWYGASDVVFVPGGLDVQHRSHIARTITYLGFNSVRLPYSDEMVRENPLIPSTSLSANPDLIGSRALDVFAAVVKACTDAGVAVIINNHITAARWCCDLDLCDGTWRNDYLGPFFCRVRQSEEQWLANWERIMRPHASDPLVIGADLRNEPRGLFGGLGWDSWASACERAAARLHALNPSWLMFVEGIASANVLSYAATRPVRLGVPHRVVYSAHVYGWSGWGKLAPYWSRKYKSFAADMATNWAFLLDGDIAPVWLGEFGAPGKPNEGDAHYWKNLMRYMESTDVDFAYWALNPRRQLDDGTSTNESYGLLERDWSTPRWDYRLYDIAKLRKGREIKQKQG